MKSNVQWRRWRKSNQRHSGGGTLCLLGAGLTPSFRGQRSESNGGLDDRTGAGERCHLGTFIGGRKHDPLRRCIKSRFLPRLESQCRGLARNALVVASLAQAQVSSGHRIAPLHGAGHWLLLDWRHAILPFIGSRDQSWRPELGLEQKNRPERPSILGPSTAERQHVKDRLPVKPHSENGGRRTLPQT